MNKEIEELEQKLEKLKSNKKDKQRKKELKAEIYKLENEDKKSSKVFKFLKEWADNMDLDD